MHIKTVILDGFKSYGTRTKLEKFDPQFNAITGFNGTGKSNILDGICFVLGLKELKRARVADKKGFIYKKGQAGVKKASVSIVFDNTDPDESPIGYRGTKEITVTRTILMSGTQKYMINGTRKTNKEVEDFFQSLRLDVNNPNFLIMQGRVTTVSGMKPLQVLGMVQETAGTKMYDRKKQDSQKRMRERESKLKELNRILEDEIKPKLKQLYQQQQTLKEYNKIKAQRGQLYRVKLAYDFLACERLAEHGDEDLQKCMAKISEDKADLAFKTEDKQKKQNLVSEKEKQVQENNNVLKEIDVRKTECAKAVAVSKTRLEHDQRGVVEAEGELKAHEESIQTHISGLKKTEERLEDSTNRHKEKKKEHDEIKDSIERKEGQLTGLGAADGESKGTLKEQLMAKKAELQTTKTNFKNTDREVNRLKKSIKKLTKEATQGKQQWEQLTYKREGIQTKILNLKKEVDQIHFNPEELKQAEVRKEELAERRDNLDQQLRRSNGRSFEFDIPQGFRGDRNQVIGRVVSLFRVRDPVHFTALSTAAGGKLWNVVTADKQTPKLLFQCANQRITCLPMNDLNNRGREKDHRVLQKAEDIVGRGRVHWAIDLIEFDPKFRDVMVFVFGSLLICTDIAAATRLAYAQGVRRKCITLDGDVADPAGLMDGGSKNRQAPHLQVYAEYTGASQELHRVCQELTQVEAKARSLDKIKTRHSKARNDLENAERNLGFLNDQIKETTFQAALDEIEEMKTKQAQLEKTAEELKEQREKFQNEVNDLDRQIKDFERERERKTKEMKEQIAKDKQKLKKLKKELSSLSSEKKNSEMQKSRAIEETAKMEGHSKELEAEIENCKKISENSSNALQKQKEQLKLIRKEYEDAKRKAAEEQGEIIKYKDDIIKLEDACEKLEEMIKETTARHRQIVERKRSAREKMIAMEKTHTWITDQKANFGKEGSDFDFETHPQDQIESRIKELDNKINGMGLQVNKQVNDQFETNNNEAKELRKKKKLVEDDRETLIKVIEELEVKKREAVETIYKKANDNFNKIFSRVLPGTQAKLVPSGETIHDGLELRVAFGNEWRESLSELSGGQKSLLGLSLILALLKCKPAPMYILDEIDSALDLSHTQNIGTMLKNTFKQTQFIVVSLKPGLFQNANIIFKTRLEHGMSKVNRTLGSN